ncbi:SoxR reducing system RseC family protein [uncultured Cetobacterium sp.]|uniref:SoxR reducing system RseC family protein n=1 Tax=uncultured Cetobacterium sp. TaxID=527638 RepID=UPI00263204FB|nr:SoxR reducing system RseC family protein [uncultured Cetobacterium sp.]
MKNSGIVKDKKGNKITISMYKESACSHCNKCNESAKITNNFTLISDRKDIEIGDIVTFEMEDKQVFKAALIVYILPLIAMFIGYFLGDKNGFTEGQNIGMSFLFLVLSFLGIFVYDKKVVKNRMEKSVKIIALEKKER